MNFSLAGIRSITKPIASLAGAAFLLFAVAGCGARSLKSVEITPTSADLVGIGSTQQFNVVATYTDGTQFDVTRQATYTIATPNPVGPATPDNAITINASGQAQAALAACSWTAVVTTNGNNQSTTTYTTAPYTLTATFDGQSGTSFVSIASIGGCGHP